MNIYDVIKKPLITEKTTIEKDNKNVVTFVVHNDANKIEIKQATEKLFKVKVDSVKTATVAGKVKRVGKTVGKRSNWKKAYVALQEGSTIDFFEV
ncbi:50S ribosomal protein L23 [Geobacter argillaceus]|uniref:Large ribosomal subunit protein uL23 n=1 Tax=Geobacter argillaceus TaxID=345631 RepID=A0A562VKF3_9BACT|nr:50S ribosomal protein L23 [Geobacter argillaceus]TWJ18335.1 LSU ribosomal protein L23P [Geobacter argillaceus]